MSRAADLARRPSQPLEAGLGHDRLAIRTSVPTGAHNGASSSQEDAAGASSSAAAGGDSPVMRCACTAVRIPVTCLPRSPARRHAWLKPRNGQWHHDDLAHQTSSWHAAYLSNSLRPNSWKNHSQAPCFCRYDDQGTPIFHQSLSVVPSGLKPIRTRSESDAAQFLDGGGFDQACFRSRLACTRFW